MQQCIEGKIEMSKIYCGYLMKSISNVLKRKEKKWA